MGMRAISMLGGLIPVPEECKGVGVRNPPILDVSLRREMPAVGAIEMTVEGRKMEFVPGGSPPESGIWLRGSDGSVWVPAE